MVSRSVIPDDILLILCSQLFEKLFRNDDVFTTKLLTARTVFCTGMALIWHATGACGGGERIKEAEE